MTDADADAVLAGLARVRADLDRLESLVRGADAPRPPAPTPAWCLLPGGLVRWEGEVVIPLRRWLLLDALLSRRLPVPLTYLEDVLGEMTDAAFSTAVCRLNHDLEAVCWPVTYHVRRGHVGAS